MISFGIRIELFYCSQDNVWYHNNHNRDAIEILKTTFYFILLLSNMINLSLIDCLKQHYLFFCFVFAVNICLLRNHDFCCELTLLFKFLSCSSLFLNPKSFSEKIPIRKVGWWNEISFLSDIPQLLHDFWVCCIADVNKEIK